jgi:hypothetical protein
MMNTTICTLFEGDYHYGVAALTNSLYKSGFRGNIYAGYRGELPKWVANSRKCVIGNWECALVLDVAEGLQLIFLPLTTDYHLTNYKPDFMLDLLAGPAKSSNAIFYFDPDICVSERWSFFEEWVSCGVALCEDVNSPLPINHPRRLGWRRYFSKYGHKLHFRSPEYINGGFIGVTRQNENFLILWKELQNAMADEIGSLDASKLARGAAFHSKGFANCFDASDQDALNATIEATNLEISVIGNEAMGFKTGGAILPHALGSGKPWQVSSLIKAVRGFPPRQADKIFWLKIEGPIKCFGTLALILYRLELRIASVCGRFYRRNG